MRRYLCLYFPNWPIQELRRRNPETRGVAVGLFERLAHGAVLAWCSHEARDLGVHPGISVADARTLVPELSLHEVDRAAALQALEELGLWAEQFSPLTGVEPACAAVPDPESLLLDITGCEQVFHGEKNLLLQAVASLRKKGFAAQAAVAPSLGAAWALAHFGNEDIRIVDDASAVLVKALQPLPVAALRLQNEALAHLYSLGIETIGDLLKQPRATLPSRFGAELLERLDQALCDAPEILTPLRPPPEFHAARAFDYPLRSSQLLFSVAEQLTAQLARELQAAERGAREIECWLYHELAQPLCVTARLFKGSASGKHLWKLLHVRLEDAFRKPHANMRKSMKYDSNIVVEAEESICAVALQVRSSEKMGSGQLPLFDAGAEGSRELSESLASLLDRLISRLGADAVLKVGPVESHIPERACQAARFQDTEALKAGASLHSLERPLWLLPAPAPLSVEWPAHIFWQGRRIDLRAVSGPERIESGWWSDCAVRRDYYRIEAESGARYWVFQRLEDARWFLHGTFE